MEGKECEPTVVVVRFGSVFRTDVSSYLGQRNFYFDTRNSLRQFVFCLETLEELLQFEFFVRPFKVSNICWSPRQDLAFFTRKLGSAGFNYLLHFFVMVRLRIREPLTTTRLDTQLSPQAA